MELIKKQRVLVGTLIVFLIIIIGVGVMRLQPKTTPQTPLPSSTDEEDEIVPTVDASTQVNLTSFNSKKNVKLVIEHMPQGTNSLLYEILYDTKEGSSQGVGGTPVEIKDASQKYEKDIQLGTCSTGGKCVFHNVVGKIKVTLKFSGTYGERMFEKEYEI